MGYSGPHCLAHNWSWPGVKPEEEEDWKASRSSQTASLFKFQPLSACCLLCTFFYYFVQSFHL